MATVWGTLVAIGSGSAAQWAQIFTAGCAACGIIFSVLRTGANAVRASGALAQEVRGLAEQVGSIKTDMDIYIESARSQANTLMQWQRDVDKQLAAIQATLGERA